MNDRTIRVRVPSETFAALEEQAATAGLTLAAYIRPLLVKRGKSGVAPMFKGAPDADKG